MSKKREKIIIVDFGSQFTQLIARRVREFGVYSEILPYNNIKKEQVDDDLSGLIFSGGPHSVIQDDAPSAPEWLFDLKKPILGICYGQQTIVNQLGGKVINSGKREYGNSIVKVVSDSPLFDKVWNSGDEYKVWMSHGAVSYTHLTLPTSDLV